MNTTSTFHFQQQPENQLNHHFNNNNINYISGGSINCVNNTNTTGFCYEGQQQQRQRPTAFFHAGSESPPDTQNYECDEEESQYSLSEFSQIHLADQDSHHQHHLTNGTAGHVGPTNFAGTHNQHHFQGFVNNHSGLLNSCIPTSTADCSAQDLSHLNESSSSVSNNNTSNRKRALSFNNGTNTGTANSPSAASNSSDKRAATKVCRVCGDKAYSYNFNVITCESCKAFFRRNANKEKEIRCPFNEQCDINIVSRRFCQRCRLQKCFRVGMKKEWIMSEEARLEKKQRIQDNRERRMAERQAEGSAEELTTASTATATAVPVVNPMEMLVNAVENNSAALLANAAAAAAVVQANAAANALPVVPTVNAPTLMHGSADEVNSANPAGLVVNTAAQQLAVAAAAAVSQALQQSQVEQHAAILPTPSDGASLLFNQQSSSGAAAAVLPPITTSATLSCFSESTSSNVEPPAQPSIVTSSPSFGQITSTLPPAPTMLSNHSADAALAAAAAALTSNIQQQQASAAPPSNTHPLLMAQQQTQQAQQHHQQQIALGAQLQAAAAVQAAQLHHATNAQQLHEQVLMQQQHQASQFLQEKALAIAAQLGIVGFEASNGWLEKFKDRHGIRFKTEQGEAGAVDVGSLRDWQLQILQDSLASFSSDCIFNADESGLFWQLLPNKTMAMKGDRCTGGKKSKERITVLVCANMSGTEKLPLLVIGKSAKPRCFKNEKVPVDYEANKKAWMTGAIFESQLEKWDRKLKEDGRKVLLYLDNCSAHSKPSLDNITLKFFPPNTTAISQAQAQAQSQQQQAAVVAANYTQLQQQQLAAAVAASQCIPGGLPPSTMVHSMLQPPSVVDLVAGQQQSMNGQHSTNLGQPMVVPAGSISSGAATLISAATGVPAQLQQTAFGVTIEHPSSMVSQVASQQPALLPTMLNAQMDTGGPVVGGAVVGGGNVQQPATHHTATSNSSQEMIAIPKDVLMKLVEHRIENDQQQQQQQMEAAKPAKCQCHCQCGRYPNELLIVDKVMTDLLENSSKQYNNNIDTDNTNRGGSNRVGCSSASSSNSFRMESNSSVNSNATPTSFLSNGGTSTQKNSLCGFDEQKVNPADYCNLTLNDQENLNELLRSNAVWNSEAGETQYGVTENGLRRLIRMISSVSGFRILDRYDQTLLLKYGCESYFVLRGTSSYNDTKISYLLQNRVSENIINFYKDFPVEWRNSETVILLLGMILLFDPQIPDLHNQLSVTVENMKYVLLLKHVLFTLCSQDINRSAQVFNELIARLDQLKTIGTLCQTENFEPIVQQMFEPQMVMATPSTTAIDTIISMANNNNNMSSM